jgi:hypothetical protein
MRIYFNSEILDMSYLNPNLVHTEAIINLPPSSPKQDVEPAIVLYKQELLKHYALKDGKKLVKFVFLE